MKQSQKTILAVLSAAVFWTSPCATAIADDAQAAAHPPIGISFELKEAGFVTLVIEDSQGRRVRNLIGETPLEAGPHTIWWDGLDESQVVPDPVHKVFYQVRGKLAAPGEYRVRGLFRKDLHLRYEFAVYSPGDPPWRTEDRRGAWLADHTPQADVLALPKGSPYGSHPQMLLSSPVTEGGCSMAWVDMDAKKLYSGTASGWQGGYALARDVGPHPRSDVHAYAAFLTGGIQVFGLRAEGDRSSAPRAILDWQAGENLPVLAYSESPYDQAKGGPGAGGAEGARKNAREVAAGLSIAAYDHVVAVSLPETNEILFVDAGVTATTTKPSRKPVGQILGKAAVPHPTGLMADASGRLYVLSEKSLQRFDVDWKTAKLGGGKVLISQGLEDPRRLAADEQGNLYVSDWGQSHQVKVFTPEGKFLRAIGKAGGPQTGPYDPNRMCNPHGIAISPDGHLWVAEFNYLPKRLSIWTLDGQLLRALYGSARYGGGGTIDPWDPARLFYAYPGVMEFHLDWDKGQGDLHSICLRQDPSRLMLRNHVGHPVMPERPFHLNGRVYLTNAFGEGAERVAGIWLLKDDQAVLLAAGGALTASQEFAEFFRAHADAIKKRLPDGLELTLRDPGKPGAGKYGIALVAAREKGDKTQTGPGLAFWSDLNGDGQMQIEEFTFLRNDTRGVSPTITVDDKLAMLTTSGVQIAPVEFTPAGAPVYDAAKAMRLNKDFVSPAKLESQALLGRDGFLVVTGGPMEGYKDGQRQWYYHSQWGGGGAKGKSPRPQYPGQLLNTMRLLGPTVTCPDGKTEVWAVCGDYGQVFLLTTDGLFVASLFKDARTADHYWPTPAQRGMLLDNVTLVAECYSPTITQTADGKVYLQASKNRTILIRLDGLETVRHIDAGAVNLTPDLLAQAKAYQAALAVQGSGKRADADSPLKVAICEQAPAVNGKSDDWKDADWVKIDDRARAAICVSGDRLYVAYHMDYEYRLENSPDSLDSLFKGGLALDLMIGADTSTDPQRKTPVPGDIRLLVTRVNNQTRAAVFRAVVPGAKEPVKYESPVGSAVIDQVEDISDKVKLAGDRHADKSGKLRRGVPEILRYSDYEFSVPLSALGLSVHDGLAIRGDVGLLVGQSGVTSDRIYWHNKSASMTSDLPTEARLTPNLWGAWQFSKAATKPVGAPTSPRKKGPGKKHPAG